MPEVTLEELLDLPVTIHKAPDVTPEIMAEYLEANGYSLYKKDAIIEGGKPVGSIYRHHNWETRALPDIIVYTDITGRTEAEYDADRKWFVRACGMDMAKTEIRVWYELTMLARKEQ